MLRDIDELLNRWGRWALRSYTGSLGYAPYSPSCRGYIPPVTAASRDYNPSWQASDIHDCDTAVKLLPVKHRRIIICHYVHHHTANKIAAEEAISKRTVYTYLHEAHCWIARGLACA